MIIPAGLFRKTDYQKKASFQRKDFRQLDVKFERIFSFGMLKHIWSYRFDKIFDSVAHLLEPDEVAVINSISRTEPASTNNPWIKKYIFPGGYILSLIQVMTAIEKSIPMVTDVEIMRLHYAKTSQV